MKQPQQQSPNYLIVEANKRAVPITSQRRLMQRAQEGKRVYLVEQDGTVNFKAFKV